MLIRHAIADDAPLLTVIATQAKGYWGYATEQLVAWRSQLTITAERIATSPVYVCELDANLIGFYSFAISAAGWELDNLWVHPAYVRQGIGRALLQHAAKIAASDGIDRIAIDADPHAEAFYLACGAHRVGAVAAPIAADPQRQRPQLALPTTAALISTSHSS